MSKTESGNMVVVVIHGYGEHVFRPQYHALVQVLESQDCTVHRHVIPGHWNGKQDHNPDFFYYTFDQILTDLGNFIAQVKEKHGHDKVFLVGKSLGGLLAIRCLQEEVSQHISGAVALSPCITIGSKYDTPLKRAVAYFLTDWLGWASAYSPWDRLDPVDITRNKYEYETDPNILSTGVYAGIAVSTRNETFIVKEKKHEIRKPLLILHGEGDKVCEVGSSVEFTADLPPYCTTHVYPTTSHDLLDEPAQIKNDVYQKIVSFLSSVYN